MVTSSKQQQELFNRLVRVADGDLELVKRAIWSASKGGDPAPLSAVIDYIQKHKIPAKEKLPA